MPIQALSLQTADSSRSKDKDKEKEKDGEWRQVILLLVVKMSGSYIRNDWMCLDLLFIWEWGCLQIGGLILI